MEGLAGRKWRSLDSLNPPLLSAECNDRVGSTAYDLRPKQVMNRTFSKLPAGRKIDINITAGDLREFLRNDTASAEDGCLLRLRETLGAHHVSIARDHVDLHLGLDSCVRDRATEMHQAAKAAIDPVAPRFARLDLGTVSTH